MHNLHTTNELIAAYAADNEFDPRLLEATIGEAIDAVYAARDAGLTMHGAGAAAAVAVLRAVAKLTQSEVMADDLIRQPQRFARLCSVIGYTPQSVINTLIEKGVDRETAEETVAEAYEHLASDEADRAAERHLEGDYGPTNAQEE